MEGEAGESEAEMEEDAVVDEAPKACYLLAQSGSCSCHVTFPACARFKAEPSSAAAGPLVTLEASLTPPTPPKWKRLVSAAVAPLDHPANRAEPTPKPERPEIPKLPLPLPGREHGGTSC